MMMMMLKISSVVLLVVSITTISHVGAEVCVVSGEGDGVHRGWWPCLIAGVFQSSLEFFSIINNIDRCVCLIQ